MIRLVIIDDDSFICDSLRTILDAQPDIEVVALGYDGNDAEMLYATHQPDILLTDIQMPNRSGLEAAAAILAANPDARVVLLTTFADDEYIVAALRMGARGYLIKQDVATIAPALRLVMDGQSVLGSEIIGRMDHLIGQKLSDITPATSSDGTSNTDTESPALNTLSPNSPLAALTAREFEITELVARGLDNREIAHTIYISEGTVRNMISSILQKLSLKNRTQLAVLYYRQS